MSAMHLGHAGRHGMQSRQLAPEKIVMFSNDVPGQVRQRKVGWVFCRKGVALQLGLELFQQRRNCETFFLTGFAHGASALAAEVDAEGLENAGTPGTLRDQLTDRPLGKRSSRRRNDVWFVTH